MLEHKYEKGTTCQSNHSAFTIMSTTKFSVDDLDMDKLTLIKMLLATRKKNKLLYDRLDKQDEEARTHEEHLNQCIDDLMAQQIKLMDSLSDLNSEIMLMNAKNKELIVKLEEQQDMIELFRKEKFASKSQKSKINNYEDGPKNEGQHGDRVQQKEDFNGDPDTLTDDL